MSSYDFSTLNSHDFELLVRDLLNAKEAANKSGISFRTFKEGKDKGIDLLYSTHTQPYEIVGQAKHYLQSGVEKLIRDLKNNEVAKVVALNPCRYVFATSVVLSVGKTDDIFNIFKPYIQSTQDIYDQTELSRLIDLYPQVLSTHFKLWFSSTAVLTRLLNYRVEGRSLEFSEYELKKRLRLYVKTPALDSAREALEKNKFVVITGEPGVGKTTTAELLLYEMISKEYKLVYIYDDIKEAEADLNKRDEKIVFYFDDFLGHNALEIIKAKGSETALLRVLKRISLSNNKLFIFTTRTFILNATVSESEKLRQFNLKAKQSLINLDVYGKIIKLQLLNNHIEESALSSELKDVLIEKKIASFIVGHLNFSPRSVEFITSLDNVGKMNPEDFRSFIYENFDSPDEIWRHAYEQQINEIDRLLLNTMLSFGTHVKLHDLEAAFYARLDYEVKNNNFIKPLHSFSQSLRRLEGGFIVEAKYAENYYTFINHSLVDFLIKHVKEDDGEAIRIAESAIFVAQLIERLYPIRLEESQAFISPNLEERLLTKPNSFINAERADMDMLSLSMMLYYYVDYLDAEGAIMQLLRSISDWTFIQRDHDTPFFLTDWLNDIDEVNLISLVSSLSFEIFSNLILSGNELYEGLHYLKVAKEKYGMDLYINPQEISKLSEHFDGLFNGKIDDDIIELLEFSHAADFADAKENESKSIEYTLKEFGLVVKANYSRYNEYNWHEVGMDNYIREQNEKDD